MVHEVTSVYMIDDSADEPFMSKLFFERQGVRAELKHFFGVSEFLSEVSNRGSFDPYSSVLVVDLNLRATRGTEAIRQIRHQTWGPEAVVGICTGSEDPADRQESVDSGADFFVGKPLDRTRLEEICAIDSRLKAKSENEGGVAVLRTVSDSVG